MSTTPSGQVAGIAYDRAGTGEALVLIHPLGGDRRVWRPILPLFTGHREIVLPDVGHIPMWDDPQGVANALLAGSAHPSRTRIPA